MPRTIEQQIQVMQERLNALYVQYGSRQEVINRRADARARGDTVEIRRLSTLFTRIQRNERNLNDLRSKLQEQQSDAAAEEESDNE